LNDTHTAWMLAFFFAITPACGSGDDNGTTDASNGSDSGDGTDSGSGTDSATGGDTGTGNDSGPSLEANFGSVTFTQTQTTTGNTTTDNYSASAGFDETPDGGVASGCSGTQSGSCCYVASAQTTTYTAVSAGGITLKDGTSTIGTMSPTGTTYASLDSTTTNSLKWNPGDALAVSAAGDTVHAFNGDVTAVALLAGVDPALGGITPIDIPKSADFTITWTSATGAILVTVGTQSHGTITCSASSDSGTMTVPHDLLGNFNSGDLASVSLSRTISADASTDNATVTLYSRTSKSGTATITQ
jgi:hypothetical protein